jgi:hypothetical protein
MFLNEQGFFPARRESFWACGLDLGAANDSTALCAVEMTREPLQPGEPDWIGTDLIQRLGAPKYAVRHLERFKLGLPYTAIATLVKQRMIGPLRGMPLIVDFTGVGRPVCDLLRERGVEGIIPVLVTGGHAETTADDGVRHTSKLILMSCLQAAFHANELKIASSLPESRTLLTELADFRVNYTASGNVTMDARSGRHDDLLFSLALAVWFLRRERSRNGVVVEHFEI